MMDAARLVELTEVFTVTFTSAMPAHLLSGAHAVAMVSATELPLAVNALIMQMRWARI